MERSNSQSIAIELKEVPDYQGVAETATAIAEAAQVQLQPGPPTTSLELFSSKSVTVLGAHHHTESVGVAIVKPEFYSFMWWDGSADCLINGEPAEHTKLYAQGGQDGFYAKGGERQTMGMALRRDEFIRHLAALQGVGPEDINLDQFSLQLSQEAASALRMGTRRIIAGAVRRENNCALDPSSSLINLLTDTYLGAISLQCQATYPRPPEQIVRIAEECFLEEAGGRASLADLCKATGTSRSGLYRAFHSVCDMSPLAYFHRRRLCKARRSLVLSAPRRGAVKRAALAAGLTELGRFSVEYSRLFGESPSTTLYESQ